MHPLLILGISMKQYNSLQEIYDTAVAGLASQEFKPSYSTNSCQYRDANGRKCAIGHCIPEDIYSPAMEGRSIVNLISRDSIYEGPFALQIRHLFAGISTSNLDNLQACHDSALRENGVFDENGFPERLKARLRGFGQTMGLQVPAILME